MIWEGQGSISRATIAADVMCIVNYVIVFIFSLWGNLKTVSGVYVYRQRKMFALETRPQGVAYVRGGDSDAL